MPADTKHPEYESNIATWQKCRAVASGEEQVKGAGEVYLPRLDSQTDDEYDAYRMRAMFYNATRRTIQGLTGAIMRRDPMLDVPADLEERLDDIGAAGESLSQVAELLIDEIESIGRFGLLVDAGDPDEDGKPTPYIATYFAENIINWASERVGGKEVLTKVVLLETRKKWMEDEFDIIEEDIIRVLRRGYIPVEWNDDGEPIAMSDGPVYSYQTYHKETKEVDGREMEEWVPDGPAIAPTVAGGNTIDFIPFVFAAATKLTTGIESPPLLDLVNVNLSHYRTSADLEHGRHFTALPTAWAAGFDMAPGSLRIGSSIVWLTDNPTATAGFLEFTGAGLASLADAQVAKERLMAVLGARLLEEQKKGTEAAATVKLRHSGEHSILARVSRTGGEALTLALRWVALWLGVAAADEVVVELNADFDVAGLTPEELTAFFTLVQGGAISWDTFFYNLQKGEVYPDERTQEEERKLIEDGTPMLGTGGAFDEKDDDSDGGDDEDDDEGDEDDGGDDTEPTE